MTVIEEYELVREVAERLGIDESQVRRYCADGRLEATKDARMNIWLVRKGARPVPKFLGRPPTWKEEE